ncbi:hypothetical protein D3C86_1691830 [compost metagenome]
MHIYMYNSTVKLIGLVGLDISWITDHQISHIVIGFQCGIHHHHSLADGKFIADFTVRPAPLVFQALQSHKPERRLLYGIQPFLLCSERSAAAGQGIVAYSELAYDVISDLYKDCAGRQP